VRKPEEVIRLHKQLYEKADSQVKGETGFRSKPVPERMAYQPTEKKEPKKTGLFFCFSPVHDTPYP
jgi:hypothetical protein